MGAGDWVSGGLRRAVSGVKSAMPGQGEAEPAEEASAVLVVDDDQASELSPPATGTTTTSPTGTAQTTTAPTGTAPTTTVAAEEPVGATPVEEPVSALPVPETEPGAAAAKAPTTRAATEATDAQVPAPESASKPHARKRSATGASAAAPTRAASDEPSASGHAPAPAATWTDAELDGFRTALGADIHRLREELNMGEADMADLLADSSDGAGDDQADAGAKTLEREQEMSVNANARDLLEQSTHALRRLEAGTYGVCESCGAVIPAARLRAFPRATLCIACKQAEERR